MSSVKCLDVYFELKGNIVFGQLARGWVLLQAVTIRLIKPFRTRTGELRYRIQSIDDKYEAETAFDLEQSQQEFLSIVLMRSGFKEIARNKRPEESKLVGNRVGRLSERRDWTSLNTAS
ncbi:hypothetical protein FOIG_09867 [Fusarium odoratissimum NRRL 54006]|uniref:Uncharacterized protein n=2 Tax=Fusarium oxysporum species complex TaxID=171631 RepID=X0JB03_FUSO5|nr:uncharacterized protein FOIG_09867 [Fusarium odoratissimum NRRL 54006]EXL98317.1 hypothetical protein FOIG_09867 [Fusarium odoratissimum NRRL 54006]TXB96216.1 hypothetical protein FocTR4_00016462 [Fusarium oxysporum f. sp. cubense]